MNGDAELCLPNNTESPSPAGGSQKDESPSKNKERDERIRLARERQKEEHRRKLEELREAMTRADEFRRKQEEDRKRKIDEMRKREEEHRAIVEERRKKLLDEENERKQAILRKTAERDAKLELKKPTKVMATSASMQGAVSVQNVARAAKPASAMRTSHSVRDIGPGMSLSISAPDRDGLNPDAQKNMPAAKKRLSVSISHLANRRKVAEPSALSLLSTEKDADVLQPLGCTKSCQSDGTLSSTGPSPSHRRPRSIAGRLPNYSCDTISSQLRVGRSADRPDGCVCSRFRSVSPVKGRARSMGNVRRSRVDVQKMVDHLSTPKAARTSEENAHQNEKQTSKPVHASISKTNSGSVRPAVLATTAAPVSTKAARSPMVKSNTVEPRSIKTPPGKVMPPPPKTIVPRTVQKEAKPTKESSTNKHASNKVKAVHDTAAAPQSDDKREISPEKEKEIEIEKMPADTLNAANNSEKSDPMKKSVIEELVAHNVVKSDSKKSVTESAHKSDPMKKSVTEIASHNGEKSESTKKSGSEAGHKSDPAKKSGTENASHNSEKSESAKKSAPEAGHKSDPMKKSVTEVAEKSDLMKKSTTEAPASHNNNAEKSDTMKKPTEKDEYKSKLAENRRLAREKAEKEAEEARLRDEELRRQEEERIRREEEEQRLREEEEMRMAEEARKQEEERFRKAVEEEEMRRKKEEEKLEVEKKERLEAEQKAQEETEKREKERAEKAKREEEERLERKKRLEMIMKRVKTDEAPKVEASPTSTARTVPEMISSSSSADLKISDEAGPTEAAPAPAVVQHPNLVGDDDSSSKFRSPLLRQMLANKQKAKAAASDAAELNGSNSDAKICDAAPDAVVIDAPQNTSETPQEEQAVPAFKGLIMLDDDKDVDTSKNDASLEASELPRLEPFSLDGVQTSELPHVESLSLNGVQTSELPNVESLSLEGVQTSELPSVESLSLEGVQTSELPNIESISLEGVQTSELPHVESFSLEGVQTSELPHVESFSLEGVQTSELPHLESFSLEGVQTSELPHVESFSLEGVQTSELPHVEPFLLDGVQTAWDSSVGPSNGHDIADDTSPIADPCLISIDDDQQHPILSNVEILSNGDVNEIELDASDKPLVDFSEPTTNSVSPKQMKMPAFLMQNGLEDQNLTDVPLIAFEENSNIVGKPLPDIML